MVSPLYTLRTWFLTSQATLPSYIRDRNTLLQQIEQLTQERDKASYDKARLAILESDNATLRRLRDIPGKERIIADVVVRPNETPYDTLVVHKGSDDGVKEGALVYADLSVVGQVVRVFGQSSLVMLFTTPDVESPVYLYGPNIFAHAYGMGGGVLRVSVPQGVVVAVGNPVSVPMTNSGIYGTVAYIESNASNPEQYAYVTQEPILQSLRFVAIDPVALPKFSYQDAVKAVAEVRLHATTSPIASFISLLPVASSTATAVSTTSPRP